MMNCHFCKRPIKGEDTVAKAHRCDFCEFEYGLHYVSTVPDDKGEPLFAHIYWTSPDYKLHHIPSPSPRIMTTMSWETGKKIHIRLNLQENTTSIASHINDFYEEIVNVPGFPLTLENLHKKLPLYILFS